MTSPANPRPAHRADPRPASSAHQRPPGRLPFHVRLMMRLSRKGLPPRECRVHVQRGIEVSAPGGVTLRTDHYIPQLSGARPTLLVRTPYGRGFPWDHLFGGLFAERGFHVVIQSCRGTGGSGGRYEPFRHERADGQAAVAWLRQQDWFSGVLGTIGPSYLGYVQSALAADPPPELRAMVMQNGVSDLYAFCYPGGAFALENVLVGTAAALSFHRGIGAVIRAMLRLQRRLGRVARDLPLIDAYRPALGGRVDFFEEWLTHPDAADPYWAGLDVGPATPVPAIPVSLLTGWHDACLDQVLDSYRRLRGAGRPVRLVVGPWTHSSAFNQDLPIVVGEALRWLREHLADSADSSAEPQVRVHVGGCDEWRDLADWPPPQVVQQPWYLTADGGLSTGPPSRAGSSSLRYDPASPTPSAGGQLLTSKAGAVDNAALEARPDVLVFTSEPLTGPVEVLGPVSARLRVRASGGHFDIFARLCDVDPRGRSRNVCDGLIRHRPDDGTDRDGGCVITVEMSATAYRFRAGNRLRLQVSGGAHPRFARNTGTGEPPAIATRLAAVDVQIAHDSDQPSALSLPVQAGRCSA